MQGISQHRNAAEGVPSREVGDEESGWRIHETRSLFALLGALLVAVTSGLVFWAAGVPTELQTEEIAMGADTDPSRTDHVVAAVESVPPQLNLDEQMQLGTSVSENDGGISAVAADGPEPRPSPRRLQIAQAETTKPGTAAGAEARSKNETKPMTEAVEPAWIAGVQPDRRPAEAPVIQRMEKHSGWYTWALTGTTRPYPESFRFLEDQEAWYTPFSRPGMTGPYDLRGWHGPTTGEGS